MVLADDVEEEEPEEEPRPGKPPDNLVILCCADMIMYYTFPFAEPTPKQYTVLLIKPDAVQAGKVDEIIEKVGLYFCFSEHYHVLLLCINYLSRWSRKAMRYWLRKRDS